MLQFKIINIYAKCSLFTVFVENNYTQTNIHTHIHYTLHKLIQNKTGQTTLDKRKKKSNK